MGRANRTDCPRNHIGNSFVGEIMKITQIRSATIIIEYAGAKFLVDPVLAPKGTYPGFPGTPHAELRNPLVDLPMSVEDILNVDAVIVTHTHLDHFDPAAKEAVPRDMPIFSQNGNDAEAIRSAGFTNVSVLREDTRFKGLTLSKTSGQHGSDETLANPGMAAQLGEVSGVVFRHPEEKTAYLAGDTVWNDKVASAITTYNPEVIIANAGWSQYIDFGGIIMGAEDVLSVHQAAPDAVIVATHMEGFNLAPLKRGELRAFAREKGFSGSLLIPADGETVAL